jgi:hypothetical protein
MKRALVLLLAACGGNDHHTTDAGPIDALTDSLPVSGDGAPGGVQLHITQGGQPVEHVATFFLAEDDKVVAAVTSNAGGIAAGSLSGGSVTAVLHAGGIDRLWTFTDVHGGDVLELALDPPGPATANSVTIAAPVVAEAYAYALFSACGDRASSVDGTFVFTPRGCGATADFVITVNDMLDVPQAALVARGVTLASPTIAGGYLPVVTPAFSYVGGGSVVTSLDTRVQLLAADGVLYAADDLQPASGGAVTTHVRLPDTAGLGMSADVVTLLYPPASEVGQQTIHDVVDPAMPYSLDLAAAMLPRYTIAPAYDVASRTLAWGEAPGGTAATMVRAAIHATRDAFPVGRSWSWQIIAAKTATNVTFPALPPLDGFSFVPAAGDTVGVDDLTTSNVPYAATRGFVDPGHGVTSGRVAVETLYTPPM